MNIGIMGGTFDPIHLGHLLAAEMAMEEAQLDEVWFMPSNLPPHKTNLPGADAKQRLDMVNLAIAGHSRFRLNDMEIRRGGTSYTVDTILELKQVHPEHMFHWIIGADMVQYLPKWHKIDTILENARFIGLQRPGIELDRTQLSESILQRVRMADMPLLEISSTMIRERCRLGKSIRYLVPEPVRVYIKEMRLYES